MIRVLKASPEEIIQFREQLMPLIEIAAGTSGGEIDAAELFQNVSSGAWQLWTALEDLTLLAIMFTRIGVYPDHKILEFEGIAGGHYEKWFPFLPNVEEWGRSLGCTRSRMAKSRKGWGRKLPDYELTSICLEKKL